MVFLKCKECGSIIKGNSESHVEELMKIHKTSKHHEKIININQSGAEITMEK